MPIIWRYLLRSYFQVLLLSVSSFVAILLVLRFQEIARFASSGTQFIKILSFALLQIPYILPIAIPVSSLITTLILFQKLSKTQELTAFRSSGIGLHQLATPLILAGLFLSLFNLSITCEIAPRCRGISKELIYQTIVANPLFIFQKESLLKMKNAYIDIKSLQLGKLAQDVVFAIKNNSNERITLMVAKELSLEEELLKGKQVALISSVDPKKGDGFDHLVIENQAIMDTKASHLSQYTQEADWSFSYEYTPLRMILAREAVEKDRFGLLQMGSSAKLEMARRVSLALAAFTFTMIGVAFGIQIGRKNSRKSLFKAIGLASFYMVCFVTAKSLKHCTTISVCAYLIPHLMIIAFCTFSLKSINRGLE